VVPLITNESPLQIVESTVPVNASNSITVTVTTLSQLLADVNVSVPVKFVAEL